MVLHSLVLIIHTATILLSPVLTKGVKQVYKLLNLTPEMINLDAISNVDLFKDHLVNDTTQFF